MALGGLLSALAGPVIGALFPNAGKAPGSGQAQQMNQNQTQAQSYATQLLTQLMPELTSGQTFANSLQPQEQTDINQTLQSLSPSSTAANQSEFNNASDQSSADAARNSDLSLQAEGLGSGARAGNQSAIEGQNAANKSAFQTYLQSPEYTNHMLNAHMAAIQQGMTSPGLGAFNDFMSQINNAHGTPTPQSPIPGQVGSALGGALAGGMFNSSNSGATDSSGGNQTGSGNIGGIQGADTGSSGGTGNAGGGGSYA